jgi:2-oxoglutarate dehydrogenase E2 component (dihydrolipoamide succinyltransferase)
VAREKGISLDELESVPRSGEGGRLSKKDVEDYALHRTTQKKEVCAQPKTSLPCTLQTERVKMTPLRKAIAENMVKSFYEAPHASLVTEVDVTKAVKQIQSEKESFQAKHGVKLSITTFVARAMTQAIHAFPLINSSLEGDTIVMKRFINLGIAVSVDQGVMVPVIKNAQSLDLPQLAKAISLVANKARSHELTLDDVQGGSITLTNFGMMGTLIGIPIIRYPEVAIVGLGAIHKKVVVMDDETLAIRSIMNVSLTFDHRVLDGLYGCGFLNELKKHLESLS